MGLIAFMLISYVCKLSVHTGPLRVNLTAGILHPPAVKAFLPGPAEHLLHVRLADNYIMKFTWNPPDLYK